MAANTAGGLPQTRIIDDTDTTCMDSDLHAVKTVPASPPFYAANSQALAITTSGAGYVSGDGVGGIISILLVNYATGKRVSLRSLQINEKGGSAIAMNLYFFKATPSAGTYTDNGAIVWGAGDSANKVGQISILAADWLTDGSQSSVNIGITEKMSVAATTLFLIIIAKGSATLTNGNLTINAEFDEE